MGLQGYKRVYRGYTRVYKGLHFTRDYSDKGIQENTKKYKRIQENTEEYIREYKEIQRNALGIQVIENSYYDTI